MLPALAALLPQVLRGHRTNTLLGTQQCCSRSSRRDRLTNQMKRRENFRAESLKLCGRRSHRDEQSCSSRLLRSQVV
jgi:hypothetical protein